MSATYFVIRYVTDNDLKRTALNILKLFRLFLGIGSSANTGTYIQGRVARTTGSRTSRCPEKRLLFMVALWNRADHYIFIL